MIEAPQPSRDARNTGPALKSLGPGDLTDKVGVVIGTRPGIIKMAPVIRELEAQHVNFFIIHTGQHYSYNMDQVFLEDLALPQPQYRLDTVKDMYFHGEQTGEMLRGIEQALLKEKPKVLIIGADTNSNLAGALAARKLHIQIGHLEGGERTQDWRVPEGHNRVMIDHISEYNFVTGDRARQNLLREAVRGKIYVTGNTVVDAAYQHAGLAERKKTTERFGLRSGAYGLMTLHREESVDNQESLVGALEGAMRVAREMVQGVLFLAHPRTQRRIREFGLEDLVGKEAKLRLEEPVGYLDFLNLLTNARLVLTDSGGVQQEACIFQVPSVHLRDATEWVETLDLGASLLGGYDPDRIFQAAQAMLKAERSWANPFGDGKAAQRIVEVVRREALVGQNVAVPPLLRGSNG